jgi:hypothetical protein
MVMAESGKHLRDNIGTKINSRVTDRFKVKGFHE